jgi:hypothetical protein
VSTAAPGQQSSQAAPCWSTVGDFTDISFVDELRAEDIGVGRRDMPGRSRNGWASDVSLDG